MIAAWLFELLRRERDWRATLPNIAAQLSDLPEDRVRAAHDLGAAFEHLEPDRRHAITAYQLGGHGRDGGRSRVLATEMGWWAAAGRLAHVELKASGALDALVMTCRGLLDRGTPETAMRLFSAVQIRPSGSTDPRVTGLRAEIEGPASEWKTWVGNARTLTGADAAGAFVTAARLARSDGQADWTSHLHAALAVDPRDTIAAAMLVDVAIASNDRQAITDLIKVRFTRLDSASYCNALRVIAARLTRAASPGHAGLARRVVKAALERAYMDKLAEIPGHLAMWTMMDADAAQDGRRTEQLTLLLRGLEAPIPACDRVWLAALGAAICIEAGDHDAARAYAAVVAEDAPSHPIVLDLLAATDAATNDAAVRHELDLLERDGGAPPALESVAPDDQPIDLAVVTMASAAASTYQPDPRYVDVRVPVLDDTLDPPVVIRSTPAAATPVASSAPPASSPPPRLDPARVAPPAVAPTTRSAPASASAAPASAHKPPATERAPVNPDPSPRLRTPTAGWDDADATSPPVQTAAAAAAEVPVAVTPPAAAPVPARASAPAPAPAPASPTPRTPPLSPPAATTSSATVAGSTVDDRWDLDEQLFLPRKRSTLMPVTVTASPTVSAAITETAKAAPPALRPIAPPLPPLGAPGRMLIPTAALSVLQSGGAPRALPKVPPPNSQSIPRAGRVGVPVDVRIQHEDRTIDVHTRDVSATGFFAITSVSLVVGTIFECELSVPVSGLSEQSFSARVRVVRRDLGGYGFVFVEPTAALIAAITSLGST